MNTSHFDTSLQTFFRRLFVPVARVALFVIYFWFGVLKVIGQSPASPLVRHLCEMTIHFMTPDNFIIIFGIFECIIGLLFLIPRAWKWAIGLMFFHMILTAGPLVLLPHEVWTHFLVPTLEGQYIIKNLALIACALGIGATVSLDESENIA